MVAIVVTVGDNIPALCVCGNDGGNYVLRKYLCIQTPMLTFGTVCTHSKQPGWLGSSASPEHHSEAQELLDVM